MKQSIVGLHESLLLIRQLLVIIIINKLLQKLFFQFRVQFHVTRQARNLVFQYHLQLLLVVTQLVLEVDLLLLLDFSVAVDLAVLHF